MKIISEISFENFEPWSGAVETFERIVNEGKADLFESILEELYPDGITDTELNDYLWFEEEQIFDMLGITEEEEDN